MIKQGQFDTEKKTLKEVKKRIRKALTNIKASKCGAEGILINGVHTIHFEIQNEDYYFKGHIRERQK